MKLKHFLAIALLSIIIISCKSKSAFNFSESIVSKEKSLEPLSKETEDDVERYFENEQYDSIALAGEKMESKVQKVIDEVNGMSTSGMKEGDNFKKASISYFQHFKDIYTLYKEIGVAKTSDLRQGKLEDLVEKANGNQKMANELQAAQRKFASANGFKVQ